MQDQRKASKSLQDVPMNIPTYVWDHQVGGSSPSTRTNTPRSIAPGGVFFVYYGAEFENRPLINFVVPLYQLYLTGKPTNFSVVILQETDIIFMKVFEAHSCLTHCSEERA